MADAEILDRAGSSTVDAENPWPGPEAFREADAKFFFGRDAAINVLTRQVSPNKLVIVYGRSGLGKTSLLQAGLFPRLRAALSLPIYIRMKFGQPGDTLSGLRSQVKGAIESAAAMAKVEVPPLDAEKTLWEWFHRADAQFFNERSKRVRPILVFDQFEEAFTLGRSDATSVATTGQLFDELIDLIRGSPPASVTSELERNPAAALQFSTSRDPCGIVISLRQEFLAELLRLRARVPMLLDQRFELSGMTTDDAKLVVTGPGGNLVADGVADLIASFVARARRSVEDQTTDDTTVDPAILSIFCRELNNKRLGPPHLPQITKELVTGTQDQIIGDFYERCVKPLDPKAREFIEEKLITESGYRIKAVVEQAQLGGLTDEFVATLIENRLLRREGKGLQALLELTHDVLTEPVVKSRNLRRALKKEEDARAAREQQQRDEQKALEQERVDRERQAQRILLERQLENTRLEKELAEQKARERAASYRRVAAVGVVVVAAVLAGLFVYRERSQEAQRSEDAAQQQLRVSRLVARAEALRKLPASPPDLSLLLGIEALRMSNSPETAQLVREMAALFPRPVVRLEHEGAIESIVVDSQGDEGVTVFKGENGRQAVLWHLPSGTIFGTLEHEGLNAVSFSRDGTLLATVGTDGRTRLWTSRGERVADAPNPAGVYDGPVGVNGVAFRPGNRMIATASDDGRVRVWDVSNRASPRPVADGSHDTAVNTVAFNARGDLLASAGEDGVFIWSVGPGGTLRKLRELQQIKHVTALVFPDDPVPISRALGWPIGSDVVVAADFGKNVRFWSLPSNPAVKEPPTEAVRVDESLLVLPTDPEVLLKLKFGVGRDIRAPVDASRFLSGGTLIPSRLGMLRLSEGRAQLFTDAGSESRETARFVHDRRIVAAATGQRTRLVVTGDETGSVVVWSIDPAFSSFSADGRRGAAIADGGVMWRQTPFATSFAKLPWPGATAGPEAIALSADGALIAAADKDTAVSWSPDKGTIVAQTKLRPPDDVKRATNDRILPPLTLEGGSLLIPRTRALQVFDAASMTLRWDLPVSGLDGAILSPDGSYVVGFTNRGNARVWSVRQPPTAAPAEISVEDLRRLVFAPNSPLLAVCAGAKAAIFDLSRSTEPLWSVERPCNALAFDHTERLIAIADQAQSVEIIEWASGTTRATVRAEANAVALAFSRSGSYLAAESRDGALHVWDMAGNELSHFQTGALVSAGPSVTFSWDDRYIFADGTTAAWSANALIEQACDRLTRNLTDDEVKEYVPEVAGNQACVIRAEIQRKR